MSWVGGLLLQAQSTPEQGVVESEFLGDWKNQLPEVWRKHVALSALKVSLSYFIIQIPWHGLLTTFLSVQILSPIERKDHVRHQFRGSLGFCGGCEYQRQTSREVAREIQEHKAIVDEMLEIIYKYPEKSNGWCMYSAPTVFFICDPVHMKGVFRLHSVPSETRNALFFAIDNLS